MATWVRPKPKTVSTIPLFNMRPKGASVKTAGNATARATPPKIDPKLIAVKEPLTSRVWSPGASGSGVVQDIPVSHVLGALRDISQKKSPASLGAAEVAFLINRGLLEAQAYHTFKNEQRKVNGIDGLKARYTNLSDSELLAKQERRNLKKRLRSRSHRFGSVLRHVGWGGLRNERELLERFNRDIRGYEDRLRDLRWNIADAESLREANAPYVQVGDVFVKLTKLGSNRIEYLNTWPCVSEGMSYLQFAGELSDRITEIESHYSRFQSMRAHIGELGFKADRWVTDYALSLSTLEGDIEEIAKRAQIISDYLYNKGLKSYRRLPIVSAVASQEGDIEGLRNQLQEIYRTILNDAHGDNYETWMDAATIMRIPGDDVTSKYSRFSAMGTALSQYGWEKNSAARCFIAAHLAQRDGDIDELASRFSELENALIADGVRKSRESGFAALALLDSSGAVSDKVARFNTALDGIKGIGLKAGRTSYELAAHLSRMPGPVRINALLLRDLIAQMKRDGFESNLAMGAFNILGQSSPGLIPPGGAPVYVSLQEPRRSSSRSSYGSSDSFSLTDDPLMELGLDIATGGLYGIFKNL